MDEAAAAAGHADEKDQTVLDTATLGAHLSHDVTIGPARADTRLQAEAAGDGRENAALPIHILIAHG